MEPGLCIAIFGGSVAGSEAAAELSKQGIHTVVFEQNPLPYGKLESGLPKWHEKLRDRQEKMIDEKLNLPLVRFVPNTKLGRDIQLQEALDEWGFSAVLIATGAWSDRPLPIDGIERFLNNGFYYQNPFVQWFNYNHDPAYKDPNFKIQDDAIIIGGGLASLDVAKIVMVETVRLALQQKGKEFDVFTLEKKGLARCLQEQGFTMDSLGIKGSTLYTRHELRDMPLNVIPDEASPEEIEKHLAGREKIVAKLQEKFLFRLKTERQPVRYIEENGRLKGIVFKKVQKKGERFVVIDGTEETVHSPMIISAIGSVPEKIPGLQLRGEIYDVENVQTGKIRGYDNVYALGNAVTGRGNIRQSQFHSRQVSENIVDQYLAWRDEDYEEIFNAAQQRVDDRLSAISERLKGLSPLSNDKLKAIENRVEQRCGQVGYDGDYHRWIKAHLPKRIEEMLQ